MWAAWYANGSVYTSKEYDWTKIPSDEIQVIVVYRKSGRTIYNGGDWYWKYNGEFGYIPSGPWGTDQPFPEHIQCKSCVKRGTGVTDEQFKEIVRLAHDYDIHTD